MAHLELPNAGTPRRRGEAGVARSGRAGRRGAKTPEWQHQGPCRATPPGSLVSETGPASPGALVRVDREVSLHDEGRGRVHPGIEGSPVAVEDPDLDRVRARCQSHLEGPRAGLGLAGREALGAGALTDLGAGGVVDLEVGDDARGG